MKPMLFLLSVLFVSSPALAASRLEARWEDQQAQVEVEDGGRVEIFLPYHRDARPVAKITDESLIYGDPCRVLEVRNQPPRLKVVVQLGDTLRDDGWNGCAVTIWRNLPGDRQGRGVFTAEFGYFIDE